jgi:PPM family protein phosphatase
MDGYNPDRMLAAHGVTNRGRRATNEDALLVDVEKGLFIVADGMGGHNAGEVASDLAIETIQQFVTTSTEQPSIRLEQAVRLANDQILDAAEQRQDYSGMGTTVAAVLAVDGHVVYTSVGDSRIYHWRGGELSQLTRDDSWLSNALATGLPLTPAEIREHPLRHVLTDVVGVRPDLEPHSLKCELRDGDALLICSDGLHGVVPPEALASALAAQSSVNEIVEGLVEEAIARGGTDNVTAIMVRCESAPQPS